MAMLEPKSGDPLEMTFAYDVQDWAKICAGLLLITNKMEAMAETKGPMPANIQRGVDVMREMSTRISTELSAAELNAEIDGGLFH